MKRFLRNNGLTLVFFALFFGSLIGQSMTGHRQYNKDQQAHQGDLITYGQYLTTGHFVEATFENWESEFLQMAAFVLLTIFLKQKGSSESKKPEGGDDVDRVPSSTPDSPWPVRHGGLILKLYESSLSLAFVLLFFLSFILHGLGGMKEFNAQQLQHGGAQISLSGYMSSSLFWFESLQNWQSEFLSVLALVVFSIFLRQKGSPESKPVAMSHSQTPGD